MIVVFTIVMQHYLRLYYLILRHIGKQSIYLHSRFSTQCKSLLGVNISRIHVQYSVFLVKGSWKLHLLVSHLEPVISNRDTVQEHEVNRASTELFQQQLVTIGEDCETFAEVGSISATGFDFLKWISMCSQQQGLFQAIILEIQTILKYLFLVFPVYFHLLKSHLI